MPDSRRVPRPVLRVLVALGVVGAALVAVGLALTQPWKLWVDETVDDVAPVAAVAAPAPQPTRFVSLDHGTTGDLVVLIDDGGNRFVRLADLATDNGPDLKVYLSANPVDGPEGAFDDDAVELGRLKGNIGSQNYRVPDDVDLTRFRSVVIWCDRFDSAFGAAPLR
jgi:hypothetical protein